MSTISSLIPNPEFFENYSEAIVITHTDGTGIFVNHAFTKLTGYNLLNSPFNWLGISEIIESEIKLTKIDKSPLPIKISVSKITLTDQSQGRVYTLIDQSANLELIQKLEAANEEFEQFAYAVSHDLQEPVRMITSYVQLVQKNIEKGNTENTNEFLNFIVQNSIRIQNLINDLLQLSRVNRKGNTFAETDLNEVVKIALSQLTNQIKECKANVSVAKLPVVRCDSTQIVHLFQNLVDNALKFRSTERTPEIQILFTETEQEFIFSVKDNGIGIEKKFWGRIFIIFQQLNSRSRNEGTGIGLAVSKKIVERHNSSIWLESEIDKGSTFYFTLKK